MDWVGQMGAPQEQHLHQLAAERLSWRQDVAQEQAIQSKDDPWWQIWDQCQIALCKYLMNANEGHR